MKVLVADDNETTRMLLKKLITAWGYQVVLASNGTDAWKMLNDSDPPQIAVLDWIMPGKTGVEICSECEKNGLLIYRILLTAKETEEDMMYALDHGAHDFQSKPITPGIMKSRLSVGKRTVKSTQEVMRSERLAAVGSLVTGVAHHFNNLNMPILMYASSILKSENLDQGVRKKIEKIEKAAQQAGELTEMLMDVASHKKQNKKLVDLNLVISDIMAIDSITFREKNIHVDTHLESIPEVMMSENEIRHVVMNLIKNACDALIESDQRQINVETGKEESAVYLKIKDSGCGIASDKIQRIFSPFYTEKGEFANPNSPLAGVKGAGVGLYASRNIADGHGGDLTVESQLGEGSTFTLWLPVDQDRTE